MDGWMDFGTLGETYDARNAPQSMGSKLGRIFSPFPSTGAVILKAHTKFEITEKKKVWVSNK
jgi:hypothetical protein